MADAHAGSTAGPSAARPQSQYFLAMAVVMLLVNLLGFAPSYFLKSLFDTPDLPVRTHIHGVIFTSWILLFGVQTALVRRRNLALHRSLGLIGAGLVVTMIVSGLVILFYRSLEYDGTPQSLAGTTMVVTGNLTLLTLFAGFAALVPNPKIKA